MKKQLIKFVSFALLVVLTATFTLPETAARYIMTQNGLMAGEINFTGATRTDTYYIEYIESQDKLTEKLNLWSNEYRDSDGTLKKPTADVLAEFGIKESHKIVYPMVNVSGKDVYCSFVISFCAMDYTKIKHQGKNEMIVQYTVTLAVTRANGDHDTLQISGNLITDLDPDEKEKLGAVNLEMGDKPQYSGQSPASGQVDYMIYTAMVDPTLATMTTNDGTALKKIVDGVPRDATLDDFVMHPGDSADCTLTLTFEGATHSKTNADACYASIGLTAKPVN